ncbi:MAG: T9SS type A sorting domain-containing protein [Saprospiraceae bacterium]|nr:T9SS type A sorting domain-containing protein [Saprospiraceae bacterium]
MIFRILPLVFFSTILLGQIPNASFESWTVTPLYEDLDIYQTSNIEQFYRATPANAVKVPGISGNALHLETTIIDGKITNGNYFMDGAGGTPYTDQPDSIKAVVRYNLPDSAMASIRIEFTRNGTLVAFGHMILEGTEDNFVTMSVPITAFTQAPDIVNIVARSSQSNVEGSMLEIDEIILTGGVEQLPNNEFENWTFLESEDPDNFFTWNLASIIFKSPPSAVKVDDASQGQYAVEVSTRPNYIFGQYSVNGSINNTALDGGNGPLPIDFMPDNFSLDYKFSSTEPDSALVAISFFKINAMSGQLETIATEFDFMYETDEYTRLDIPLNLPAQPDSFGLFMVADSDEAFRLIPELGRTLTVDNLFLDMQTGLEDLGFESVTPYPNPTTEIVTIDLPESVTSAYEVSVRNGLAQEVKRWKADDQQVYVDLRPYEGGYYTIIIRSGNQQYYAIVLKQ